MKTALITICYLLSSPAMAQENCHTVRVCNAPARKVVKKPIKKVVHREAAPREQLIVRETKVIVIQASEPRLVKTKAPDREPSISLEGHLAAGLGAQEYHLTTGSERKPFVSGLLGLRLHVPALHLGLEGYTALDYGAGLQLLVYPYQGKNLNVHVNAGVLGAFKNYDLSTDDVPRPWDMTVGAGLEYRLGKHVALALDWRWAIPSPVFVADHSYPVYSNGQQVYGSAGRYLASPAVIGNSLLQSQLLLGVLFR